MRTRKDITARASNSLRRITTSGSSEAFIQPKNDNLAIWLKFAAARLATPFAEQLQDRALFQSSSTKRFEKKLQPFSTAPLKEHRIQIQNVVYLSLEFLVACFDGSIFKIPDFLVNSVIGVRWIPLDVAISLPGVAVLLLGRFPFISPTRPKEIGVDELLVFVQVLAVPVRDLHGRRAARLTRANTAKAVAAQPALLSNNLLAQNQFVPKVSIVGAWCCAILRQAPGSGSFLISLITEFP